MTYLSKQIMKNLNIIQYLNIIQSILCKINEVLYVFTGY
jgi:hypothetical protein